MFARIARLPLLVVLLGVTGCLALLPALHALAFDDHELARAFFYSALVLLLLAIMLGIATAGFSPRDVSRSQLASLVGAYLLLPFAMLLPLAEAVPDTSLMNAWFEMTSALTTTGATVFDPARLSDTVHLWRATMGWFGGYLILLGAYAILAPLNLGGFEVATGRVPGRGTASTIPRAGEMGPALRLTRLGFRLLPVYVALTAVLWLGLLLAGETATTSLIHAMGTLSTSGIAGRSGLGTGGAGLLGEGLVLLFLIFALSHRALKRLGIGRTEALHRDPELRLAAALIVTVTLIFGLLHAMAAIDPDGAPLSGLLSALWGALFTAASFLSTTGYVSVHWPQALEGSGVGAPGLLLLGLALVGGGVATTAGGVKLLRVYALLRQGERELERIIHPNSVAGRGSDARRLRSDGAQLAWVFFVLFATAIAIVMAALLLSGQEFEPALVLSLSALTTTGPLADLAGTAPISYADMPSKVKITLGLAMIVGRLETLALFALFLPLARRDS